MPQAIALLFDARADSPRCQLCQNPARSWVIPAPSSAQHGNQALRDELHRTFNALESAAQSGLTVVLSLSYEAYPYFSAAKYLAPPQKPQAHADIPPTPLLQAVAFEQVTYYSPDDALAWLENQCQGATWHLDTPEAKVSQDAFINAIETIRAKIAAGQTYQVNYTYPYTAELRSFAPDVNHPHTALCRVFADWVRDLNVGYAALLQLPENTVLSFSPELFFTLEGNTLTTRPMKGTAPIGADEVSTAHNAHALAHDPKNRAENLMIVDLMRNDVARLHQTTAVSVPELFAVKAHGQVLQMTSTVEAQLHTPPSLWEIFNALYPCGSITGAPKHETLKIINELEPYARGSYCGTIGVLQTSPTTPNLSVQCNVAIRTLELPKTPRPCPLGGQVWAVQGSVGAGITYDSNALEEWDECVLKSRFFTRHASPFEVIETLRLCFDAVQLRWSVDPQAYPLHCTRLLHSCTQLGWQVGASDITDAIQRAILYAEQLGHPHDLRLRLAVNARGHIDFQVSLLEILSSVVKVGLAPRTMHHDNPYLRHKTSHRAHYNHALDWAKAQGWFDALFINQRGELTEGARSVVLVKLDGQWFTPPLHCGVLPSIARQIALNAPHHNLQERILFPADLAKAQAIQLANALYGVLDAHWMNT